MGKLGLWDPSSGHVGDTLLPFSRKLNIRQQLECRVLQYDLDRKVAKGEKAKKKRDEQWTQLRKPETGENETPDKGDWFCGRHSAFSACHRSCNLQRQQYNNTETHRAVRPTWLVWEARARVNMRCCQTIGQVTYCVCGCIWLALSSS